MNQLGCVGKAQLMEIETPLEPLRIGTARHSSLFLHSRMHTFIQYLFRDIIVWSTEIVENISKNGQQLSS